jgi:polar amino acid transport system permease protein
MEYPMITPYLPLLLQGTAMTIVAWIVAGTVSIIIGTCMGILSCRYLAHPTVRAAIRLYTFVAKGIPAYVLILIAYFVLPALLGVNISGFAAACGALALSSSGYVTEIIRSGIDALPRGQWDACFALGYPLRATLTRIILPQAFATMAPPLVGEGEQLLKSTSLLATIGVTELTRSGMNIISRELNPIPIYLTIAAIYLIFSGILQTLLLSIEKRNRYGRR